MQNNCNLEFSNVLQNVASVEHFCGSVGLFLFHSQQNFRGLGVLQEMIYAWKLTDETVDEFCCSCQLSYHFTQVVMGFAPLCVVQKVSGQTYRSAMSNKIVDPNFSFVLPLWGIERCCFMFDWKSKKLSGLLDAYSIFRTQIFLKISRLSKLPQISWKLMNS